MLSVLIHVLILLLIFPYRTKGWWRTGHMIVSQIAKNELLRSNTELYEYIEQLSFYGSESSEYFYKDFQYVGVWAIDIQEQGINIYDQWHFTNLPINDDGFLKNFDKKRNNNASWIIDQITSSLTNYQHISKFNIEKSILLRLLIHIIGDIHQPLHNSDLFNDEFNTEIGDNAGYLYTLQNITVNNLHDFWDSCALQIPEFNQKPIPKSSLDWVSNYSRYLQSKYPRDSLTHYLSITEPRQWIQESYYLARQKVYEPLNGSRVITTQYTEQTYELIQQRLVLAGYRLADYLQNIFKNYEYLITRQQYNYHLRNPKQSFIKDQ